MISPAPVAQLLGGDETLPGAAERGDALERAVRAGLPFVAVRRLIESGRLTTAEEVFLDQGRAGRWLRSAHPELDGRLPLEVAASELGARRVETMLWQIAARRFARIDDRRRRALWRPLELTRPPARLRRLDPVARHARAARPPADRGGSARLCGARD